MNLAHEQLASQNALPSQLTFSPSQVMNQTSRHTVSEVWLLTGDKHGISQLCAILCSSPLRRSESFQTRGVLVSRLPFTGVQTLIADQFPNNVFTTLQLSKPQGYLSNRFSKNTQKSSPRQSPVDSATNLFLSIASG